MSSSLFLLLIEVAENPSNLVYVVLEENNEKFRVATKDGILFDRWLGAPARHPSLTTGDVQSQTNHALLELVWLQFSLPS